MAKKEERPKVDFPGKPEKPEQPLALQKDLVVLRPVRARKAS